MPSAPGGGGDTATHPAAKLQKNGTAAKEKTSSDLAELLEALEAEAKEEKED